VLRHRNFRLFFYGQSLSLIGTWTQQIAMSWLVYRMTGSAFLLGLTVRGQIPFCCWHRSAASGPTASTAAGCCC
jgi:hypothetical protein